MFRKISILVSLLALATAAMSVSAANPLTDGCFVNSTITKVNEGMPITVSIECANIPATENVFGFQFGTTVTAVGIVGSVPSTYTPGTFTTLASAGFGSTFVGENSLALYAVSRQVADVVTQENFSLGTLALTAETNRGTKLGLSDADGIVDVIFDTGIFKLSNDLGAELLNWIRTNPDAHITINDIDLAWLNGSATVKSDSTAIGSIKNVTLNLGAYPYTATTLAISDRATLPISAANLYVENASGVVGGSFAVAADSDNVLDIPVSADMWGHLACSTSAVDLGDVGEPVAVTSVAVGTLGTVTLKAGDVDGLNGISVTDASIITGEFGADNGDGGAINASYEGDINLDGTVDILDLVHIGRNFGAPLGAACS